MEIVNRLVRVFISSTFRDFMEERDLIVKKIFPELRHRCRDRFVEIVEIDLRWGITEEQSKTGKVLPICLTEIDKCRASEPVFFIGLLGERYGWIPKVDEYPKEVLENPDTKWVTEHIGGKSVTELEILHGVLNNPKMSEYSFFYFRDNKYSSKRVPDFKSEDKSSRQKQEELKQKIIDRKLSVKNYPNPEVLGKLILEKLWKMISDKFPISEIPDEDEIENREHQIFLVSRSKSYVPRKDLYNKLNQFKDDEESNIKVILGVSGSGKSALIVSWLQTIENDTKPTFYHFIGGTPKSANAVAILKRFHSFLKKLKVLQSDSPTPNSHEDFVKQIPIWFEKFSNNGGGLIIFDALNQLTVSYDRSLWWLPKTIPKNIHLIVSTLPGETYREVENRGWLKDENVLNVPLLENEEKSLIINEIIKYFSKNIEKRFIEKIINTPQTNNPLFLRTVLEELRQRSVFENFDKNLNEMLNCKNPEELFIYVLKDIEKDFRTSEKPDVIHKAFGLMGLAKRGLTESELLELLSDDAVPSINRLPRIYWSPVFLSLAESLIIKDGQLNFGHDYIRTAILNEYLDEEHERKTTHNRLSNPLRNYKEKIYGATLHNYAFQFGITHIIEEGNLNEAIKYICDPDFRLNAAIALHNIDSIIDDIRLVRLENAKRKPKNYLAGAEMTYLALNENRNLTFKIIAEMEKGARNNDWDLTANLTNSGKTAEDKILLAIRAVLKTDNKPSNDFWFNAKRQASNSGKEEWKELIEILQE